MTSIEEILVKLLTDYINLDELQLFEKQIVILHFVSEWTSCPEKILKTTKY